MMFIVIAKLEITVDICTLLFAMYNFSVVGVLTIFYQKGTPVWLTQMYLIATSVIMAWQLGQFPEWSTWALVIVLAFYDLCAVLTPCGPLKWLVNLVQQEGRPLPGTFGIHCTMLYVVCGLLTEYRMLGGTLQVCCTKQRSTVITQAIHLRTRMKMCTTSVSPKYLFVVGLRGTWRKHRRCHVRSPCRVVRPSSAFV